MAAIALSHVVAALAGRDPGSPYRQPRDESGLPISRVIAGVMPFFIPLLLSLFVVSAIPALFTWLPETLMK